MLSGFPFTTPYDPSQDPASSVDPLGTTSVAERLSDLLLPGLTARMWRPRLLTFSAVAALVAARAAELLQQDDLYESSRLTFERLYVAALVREAGRDPDLAAGLRRVPGIDRARAALTRGEPLTRASFLKGQSVNGPTGVMARLSRNLNIVDEESHLNTNGQALALAWAKDEGLSGILEGKPDAGEGGKWLTQMARATLEAVKGQWPGGQSSIWTSLVARLRPDGMQKHERKFIIAALTSDPSGQRARTLALLVDAVETYKEAADEGRSAVERAVMQNGVRVLLGNDALDLFLGLVLEAIGAHEECSALLLEAFDTIRWSLSSKGALAEAQVLADKAAAKTLDKIRKQLARQRAVLDAAITRVIAEPAIDRKVPQLLRQMSDDIAAGLSSPETFLSSLLDRHRRVQQEKGKGEWIERGERLTIMPGFGFPDQPTGYSGLYLHPFRIQNAYAMLNELGVVKVGVDEEDE